MVTFLATLIDSGGALGGNVTEPCILPRCLVGGTHNASIAGHRSGSAVSFIKRYEPSGCGYDTVTYEAWSMPTRQKSMDAGGCQGCLDHF